MLVPDPYIFKDLTQYQYPPLATPKVRGIVYVLDDKFNVQLIKPSDDSCIFLPRVTIEILIENVNIHNVDTKYDEYMQAMTKKRYELLNKLNQQTVGLNGRSYGLYYFYLFMTRSCDSNKMLFTEEFSAIWSQFKLISKLDYPFTIH